MHRSVLLDGRRRSVITLPGYRAGMKPANFGHRYPAEILTRTEVARLLAACSRKGHAGVRDRALIVVMWRGGLRVAEALALKPHDVDLDHGTIAVLHGKGDRRRTVGIDPDALAVIERWMDRRRKLGISPRAPLFCTISRPHRGQPLQSSCVRETLKLLARRSGIEKRVHPHGLRHTHAYELAAEGVPVHVIRMQLGHSSLATTERYINHLNPTQVIAVMQQRRWAALHELSSCTDAPGGEARPRQPQASVAAAV